MDMDNNINESDIVELEKAKQNSAESSVVPLDKRSHEGDRSATSRQNLWAPWRNAYVIQDKSTKGTKGVSDCVFCNKLAKQDTPENNKSDYLLHRGKYVFVVMNLYPYNNGHILILPNRHVADILDLTKEESIAINDMQRYCIKALRDVFSPDGFNIGYNLGSAAGAGIAAHLHQHIVPRWNGDTNFMPVIGEVRVISEHMDATFDKIKTTLDKILSNVLT